MEILNLKAKDLMIYDPKALLCGTIGCSNRGTHISYVNDTEEVITKEEPVLRAIRPSIFCGACFKVLKKG